MNRKKTNIVNVGYQHTIHNCIKMENTKIKIDSRGRYLGIHFKRPSKNRPRWNYHCRQRLLIAKRTASKIYPLISRQSTIEAWNKIRLIKSITTPQLLYGCEIWAGESSEQLNKMESWRNRLQQGACDAHYLTRNAEIHERCREKPLNETPTLRRARLLDSIVNHPDDRIGSRTRTTDNAATTDILFPAEL